MGKTSDYRGPPLKYCPYCFYSGRGTVSFIPVVIPNNEAIWLCRNWKICLFPHVYGSMAVREQTVALSTVDPQLIGYIPMFEGDKSRYGPSVAIDVQEIGERLTPAPLSLPSPLSISHSTTSSEGSDHDIALCHGTFATTNTVRAISTPPLSVSPVTFTILQSKGIPATAVTVSTSRPSPSVLTTLPSLSAIRRRQLMDLDQRKKTSFPNYLPLNDTTTTSSTASTSSPTTSTATEDLVSSLRTSRKRPLVDTKKSEKPVFPSYGDKSTDERNTSAPRAEIGLSSNDPILSMVAAQMKKMKRKM